MTTTTAVRAGRITGYMTYVLGYSLLGTILLVPIAAILAVAN